MDKSTTSCALEPEVTFRDALTKATKERSQDAHSKCCWSGIEPVIA